MCFSATASFTASGALAIAGVVSMKTAKKEERLLAIVPLLFALQQFIEGLQWLAPHPSTISQLLGYGFLFFAFLLWPTYIPIVAYSIEKDARRKRLLRWCIGVGLLTSLGLLYVIPTQSLSVQLLSCGINYNIAVPFVNIGIVWYLIATCGSLAISSSRFLQIFGTAGFLSAVFTAWVFSQTFTSVWCFFAAALSISLFLYFRRKPPAKTRAKRTA